MAGPDKADCGWGVLGGPWATVHGRDVALGRQSRFLLALLLQRPGRPVPVDRIAASAGGSRDRAVAAARMAMSRLRTQLGAEALDGYVDTTAAGYVIDVDPLAVDHVAFEQRIREADAIEWPDAALRRLESALALWRGEPFGDFGDDEPFDADARTLAELHRRAVDGWGELALRAGRHREALSRLEAAALDEPLRERRWASLVLAHYRSGNQTQALREYERARQVLRDQVGLEPGVELRQLAARILDQDPDLDWRPARQRARAEALRPLTKPSVLLGRDREVNDVLQLLERHRVVTISGLGGIGKSSVAGEVARRIDRPVWVAALADVAVPARLVRSVAAALGLATEASDDALLDAIADHIDPSGLLVLDNCEHLLDAVGSLVASLVALAPGARILATSRAELHLTGAMTYSLSPLDVGTPTEPGPAALIAADFAMVPPSEIEVRWDEIVGICRHADGVPLALELLGAAAAAGALSLEPHDAVSTAVMTALASLPAEARDLVLVLAALPSDASPTLLEWITRRDDAAVRRALGFAMRAGLVIHRAAGDTSRVRVLEPARDVIDADGGSSDLVDGVHAAVRELLAASRTSLIGPLDPDIALLVDDEHNAVIWLLERLSTEDRLDLVLSVATIWRTFGRASEGHEWLDIVERELDGATAVDQARFWVMRAQMSPSLSARVPYVDRLRWAMEVADREGADDLAGRAGAELAIGLGISGALRESSELLDKLTRRLPPDNAWAEVVLNGLRALARAALGDPVGASSELLRLARAFPEVGGHAGDSMSNTYLAVSLAQIAGDDELVRTALQYGEEIAHDRFAAYSYAALRFEGARFAVRNGDPDGGRLLWEALGALSECGEHRPTEICRRELGRWRVTHGDAGGVADLARAARTLVRHDPTASAVAIAALLTEAHIDADRATADALAAALPTLLVAPGGAPLSAADRAVVDGVPAVDSPADLDGAVEILHTIERAVQ